MKGRPLRNLLVATILLLSPIRAANYDVNPTLRGSWPNFPGPWGQDMSAVGRIVFVALGQGGFEILDFTDLNAPKFIATFPQEGFVGGLVANGNRLYVTDEAAGLHIFDISDPRKPIKLSTTALLGPAAGVAVSGTFAYVTAKYAGLHIIDVGNPDNPKRVSTIDTPGTALRVVVDGNTVFVADYDSGLRPIDVSDPKSPTLLPALTSTLRTVDVGVNSNYIVAATWLGCEIIDRRDPSKRVNLDGRIEDLFVTADRAYLIDNPQALRVVDLPANSTPTVVGNFPDFGAFNGYSITYADGFVYVVDHYTIEAIDVSTPTAPRMAASFSTDNEVDDAAIVGQYAYVLNQGKLNVVDVSSSDNPTRVASLTLPPRPARLSVSGNVAGIGLRENGVIFIDISNPRAPREFSRLPLSGDIFAITMLGDRAYVSGQDSGLYIIDLHDPAQPQILGRTDTARIAAYTAVSGDYAYVAAYQDGLQIFNIANPANIKPVGTLMNFTGLVRTLVVRGTNLFSATDGGLQIFDITNPATPKLIADDHQLAGDLTIFGDTAYVAGIGLRVVDIPDPTHPQTKFTSQLVAGRVLGLAGSLAYLWTGTFQIAEFVANPQRMARFPEFPNAFDVTVKGKYAYLAGKDSGLRIVDISHSANPEPVAQLTEPTTSVEVRGNRAFAVGSTGFRILDMSKADQPQIIGSITGQRMQDVAVSGKFAYATIVGDAGNSLAAIDCTSLSNPQITATRPIIGKILAVSNEYAYVSDYGVRIFDISDPTNPTQVGLLNSIGSGEANDIAVRGSYVYLAANYSGFLIIDVSDPTNPWLVGRSSVASTIPYVRLSISGDYAYLGDGSGGLHVFDIRHVGHPERVGGNVQVNISGLYASSDTLYIAEGADGLTILDLFRPDAGKMRLTGLEPMIDGVARLRATGPAGQTVQIERFVGGVWQPFQPLTTDHAPTDFADPQGSEQVQFYRIAAP